MLVFGITAPAGKPADALYESLISRIAGGDKEALSALYENTKDAVFGFSLSILRNRHEAEDVMQDAFISIYAQAVSYIAMGKPMAWIMTITKNLSLMKLRSRGKTAAMPEDGSFLTAAPTGMSSEDRIVLAAAMETITPEESQIVTLHAVAGFKHRETAKLLDLPLSTVLSKYNRAVKKLKKTLDERL